MNPILYHPAYIFHPGRVPLLISMPHIGTHMPKEQKDLLSEEASSLPDTDWHLDKVYSFAREMGAGLLMAQYSRFLIDLNRPEDDKPLYEGATTGLFPDRLFNGKPIYKKTPETGWRDIYFRYLWKNYHQRLRRELDWMKEKFGYAILLDAHSIASHIPRLFEGVLPHFNLGTHDGYSCEKSLADDVFDILSKNSRYQAVLNGRFKGGYITRHYGQPQDHIHALQLELAQRSYMKEEAPYSFDPIEAAQLQPILKQVIARLIQGL